MVHKRTATFLSTVAALCLLSGGAWAGPQSKCLVSKNKCMSKKAGSLLKCQQKAETPGKPPDPNFGGCVDKAKSKFGGGADPSKGCFEKAENKSGNDCVTFNDTAAAEASVDDCVDKIVLGIDPGGVTQTKCGVGKKKCVAKKLKSILKCYQKAETPGKPTDPNTGGCIDKAMAKYDGGGDPSKGCFVKLEQKPGNDCAPPIGNQGLLEDVVDSCAGAFVAIIETPTTSTTTTTVTTTTVATTSTTTTSTTTTTVATTSTTTTTAASTTTTTTMGGGGPTTLDFTTGPAVGVCGETRDGSNVLIKNLTCGGLNIGGGASTVAEGPVPNGSTNRFGLSCTGSACNVSATSTVPAVNSTQPDCTTTGCNFGAPLPIPNVSLPNLTTCVLNTYQAAASGTLDLSSGASVTTAVLTSDIYLTGNVGQPCPVCRAGVGGTGAVLSGTPASPATGFCDRGPRATMACTTTNTQGLTRDCLTGGVGAPPKDCQAGVSGHDGCVDGTHVGPITVNLSPLTTTTTTVNTPDGNFCPLQGGSPGTSGCFGSGVCRTITENGSPAGLMTTGVPAPVTLAYVFCITATPNGLVNFAADLPGPGAVSLPGTFTAN